MSSNQAPDEHHEPEKTRQAIPETGSTRFRNKDFAEQREHWHEEDDRR